MNTIKSFWLGWGSLCVAGGGAYYFAKRSINADRAARYEEIRKQREHAQSLLQPPPATTNGSGPPRYDSAGSPSQESTNDPAPTRHAPATESQRVTEKSKYESSTPFISPKGDRFS